jgi:hypothetical protein
MAPTEYKFDYFVKVTSVEVLIHFVVERLKKQHYKKIYSNNYFWRTWNKKEIDMVEEREGKLFGYEFKYDNKKLKAPKEWSETYSNSSFEVINKNNYYDFIL